MAKVYDEDLLPLKYGVFATNFMLWALGVALLGIAIWVRSDSALWVYVDNMSIGRYYAACYICLIAGAIILMIAFCGCVSAARESTTLMFAYFIVCAILIVLEIAAAVLVWQIPGGDRLQRSLGQEFRWHMEQRLYNDDSRDFLDLIQLKLDCCGAETMLDYRVMHQDIPASCNNPRTNNINIRSCSEQLRRYLEKRGGAIGGICVGLILVKLGAFFFTFLLMRESRENKYNRVQYR
ncbi:hypothetical protein BLOT_005417 [Blomia tropicalis]|nr:hypothetical protein BLOT_005417 [Blomia tropicalis]